MEEQLSSLAVTHLLQHTLRSLCIHDNSQWVYAVFWRILPRNYPPPKWEGHGAYDRSRGNRRNWILVWEDGFCNFAALSSSSSSPTSTEINSSGDHCSSGPSVYGHVSSSCDNRHHHHDDQFNQFQGLQPELFFKMSHEIYNYGEGLIGKVAADHSHKWIYKEPNDQEINFLSAWHNSADSHPRTWEAQFQSGIKTIALIAVREGVIQLGATHKVIEDLSYVVLLRKKLSYIESIPGVLLPHPSSSPYPYYNNNNINNNNNNNNMISNNHNNNNHYITNTPPDHAWHFQGSLIAPQNQDQFCHTDYHQFNNLPLKITPSMSSLEALLSKLPSVVPPPPQPHVAAPPLVQFPMAGVSPHHHHQNFQRPNDSELVGLKKAVAKDEVDEEEGFGLSGNSNGFAIAHHHHHQDHNVASASGPTTSGF